MIGAFFGSVKSVMDKLPNYDQKKKAEFDEKYTKFLALVNIPDDSPNRDDDLLLNLLDELSVHVRQFSDHLGKTDSK